MRIRYCCVDPKTQGKPSSISDLDLIATRSRMCRARAGSSRGRVAGEHREVSRSRKHFDKSMVRDKQHLQAVGFSMEMNIAFQQRCSIRALRYYEDHGISSRSTYARTQLASNTFAMELYYLFPPNSSSQFQLVLGDMCRAGRRLGHRCPGSDPSHRGTRAST